MKLRVLHERLGRWRLLQLLSVDRRRGRILGRGGSGVGHGGLTEGPVVEEVLLGREPLYVLMFGSGFRSVTGQFRNRPTLPRGPAEGNRTTGADGRSSCELTLQQASLKRKRPIIHIHGL